MLFKDIIGQERLKKELIDSVNQGRIAHTQLFAGESGYGALALTIAYAQYINCQNRGENDSCGVCPSCFKYNNLQHPDLHFIYPINKSPYAQSTNKDGDIVSDSLITKWREIMLEREPKGYFSLNDWCETIEISKNSQPIIARSEANHLISKLGYKSFEGGYSVVIIWLAEMMNEASANALLKLFEEPAEKTLFLFVSHDRKKMLKTILSRSQIIDVKPINRSYIINYLINNNINNDNADNIASLSQGDLLKALSSINNNSERKEELYFDFFIKLMRLCFSQNYLGLAPWAEDIAVLNKEEQKGFISYSIKLLRDAYLINIGASELSFAFEKERDFLKKFSLYVHHQNLEIIIAEFEKCNQHLIQNVNTKALFTHFTLAISKLIKLPIDETR